MRITVLSLFPNIFNNFLKTSIIKRIIDTKLAEVEVINFRKFANNKHQRVDEYQYGGGAGMIIQLPPIVAAIKKYRTSASKVILLSPQGKLYHQTTAKQYAKYKHLILIAGHYEGFDERLIHYVDEVISIGDYILMGGEVACMVVIESVLRLLQGAITPSSLDSESFLYNLLDYPVYTKPLVFDNHQVPKILLSGDHQKIKAFRQKQQIIKTKKNRPDLYKQYLKNKHHD
jgi:tRNA (guanine37-N1)-methyltransferase